MATSWGWHEPSSVCWRSGERAQGGLGDPKKCGVLGEVGDVVGRTVEDVVARVHLGELGHFGHRVAAGWSGADAGLGARNAGLAQPGGTGGVVTTPLGMAERGMSPPP